MSQCTATAERPLQALRSFAGALGWKPLRACEHVVPAGGGRKQAQRIVWYESGLSQGRRSDLFLQINQSPIGAVQTYQAAVYAPRYRLFTGWHKFRLTDDLLYEPGEAVRLDDWLLRHWFDSLAARREFRVRHPECVGFSWKRIREAPLLL